MTNSPPEPPQDHKDNNEGNNNSPFNLSNARRFWTIIGVVILLLLVLIIGNPSGMQQGDMITLNQLVDEIKRGNVAEIAVRGGNDVMVRLNNGQPVTYYKERETDIILLLKERGITQTQLQKIEYVEEPGDNTSAIILQFIVAVVPTLIIIWLSWRMIHSIKLLLQWRRNMNH